MCSPARWIRRGPRRARPRVVRRSHGGDRRAAGRRHRRPPRATRCSRGSASGRAGGRRGAGGAGGARAARRDPGGTAGSSPCGAVPVRVAVETGMAVMTGDVHIDGMGCSVGVAAARLGAQAPAGAVLLGPVAARAVRDVMVLGPPAAARWPCGANWPPARPARPARPSSVARRSSPSWPNVIAAPRAAGDRSCSSPASRASASPDSWTS